MSHRPARFTRSPLRWPGLLVAGWWHGGRALWARLAQALLFRAPGAAARIAVYRIGSYGDLLCALPALRAIRAAHPQAEILLLSNRVECEPWARRLDIESELALNLADYASAAELRRAIKEFAPGSLFYLAPHPLSLWRALRDMLFFRSCGVRHARGFAAVSARGWVARALRPWFEPVAESARLLRAADLNAQPATVVDSRADGSTLVFAPTGKSAVQHWPVARWQELAGLAQQAGFQVCWLGDEHDRARMGELPGDNRMGSVPLNAIAEVLRSAAAVVCHDSGVAHHAALLGRPTVVISSSRAPVHAWDPPAATVLRTDMNCEACHRVQCSDNACINAISVEAVWTALQSQISRR